MEIFVYFCIMLPTLYFVIFEAVKNAMKSVVRDYKENCNEKDYLL